ncbi:MAG: F0F1 ATP synthase subunit epsilon [Gemmatimonadales bacterium]
MRVTLVSPERPVFDGPAESVVAPAFDGLVGILPHHAPFMTLLGEGVFTVQRPGGETERFQVAGGFLQVTGDTVRVVVERAEQA